jgi:hypothetical protein
MAECLNISTKICFSSQFHTSHLKRSERVLALLQATAAKIYYSARGSLDYMVEDGLFPSDSARVYFQDFKPRPYPQFGTKEFQARLSAVDTLFSIGPEKTKSHLRGTPKWLSWNEAIVQAEQ